ncbi:MAG TPA: aldo/keto reductase [Steroidobacteraceae bacterium]|nr:aldo/keto reductase [Steroidobacteraceae bacterium]
MELALGTVQFGVVYGVTGVTKLLLNDEVREILEHAFKRGITILDTAQAYGDIESRLGMLCEGLGFRIVSKIPPVPEALDNYEAGQWVIESAQVSRERLGRKLYALLFHRAENLTGSRGETIWEAVSKWGKAENVLIGASGYDAADMRQLFLKYRMPIAQLPGNALDQRINCALAALDSKPELHLRSAFLQGLLLLPIENAVKLVPAGRPALARWQQWLKHQGISAVHGALSVVKSFEDVSTCVVGVDNLAQIEQLVDTWEEVRPINDGALACADPRLIDPRQWSTLDQ